MKHIFTFVLLASVSATAFASEMKTLTFQKDLLPREARAWEYDKASSLNTNNEVSFKLDGDPQVVAGSVQLTGTITNTSPSKKTIYIVGDKDTLKVELETNDRVKLRDPKKSSPPMFALEIPARTNVKIVGSARLDHYIYEGSPETNVNWTFQFWNPPKPHGHLKMKLPTASEAKLPPLKIEFQKFTAQDDAKITASLRNVSNEAYLFCRGSQAAFTWDLKNVDGTPIETVERLASAASRPPMNADDCFTLKPNESKEVETANVKKDGDTYRFETPHATWTKLKTARYNVHFSALNSAAGGTQTTETTQSISIP